MDLDARMVNVALPATLALLCLLGMVLVEFWRVLGGATVRAIQRRIRWRGWPGSIGAIVKVSAFRMVSRVWRNLSVLSESHPRTLWDASASMPRQTILWF
jgi:hypothetical protein